MLLFLSLGSKVILSLYPLFSKIWLKYGAEPSNTSLEEELSEILLPTEAGICFRMLGGVVGLDVNVTGVIVGFVVGAV